MGPVTAPEIQDLLCDGVGVGDSVGTVLLELAEMDAELSSCVKEA